MRTVLAALLLAAAVACNQDVTLAQCDSAAVTDGGVFKDLSVNTEGAAVPDADDAGTLSIPILVQVRAPCLLGGVHASVQTTAGKIGDSAAGTPLSLLLSRGVDADAGFQGHTTLQLANTGSALVTAQVGDVPTAELRICDGGTPCPP